ncbi:MAG: hypothetical protein MUO19_06560 [Dehalococcoidales bacterium]|nr:hypothetical protein [Dehalococcoidales bacterium]
MKFKSFKNISLKKKGGDTEDDAVEIEGTTAEQIAEMEKKLNGRTKNLEETAELLNGLSGKAERENKEDEEPVGPHPPLGELSLDDIGNDDADFELDTPVAGDPIQVVEMSKGSALSGAVEPVKVEDINETEAASGEETDETAAAEVNLESEDNSMNNLFDDEEEEENPLANLINFLPDVSVQELIDDIEEIKGIIKEWQKS